MQVSKANIATRSGKDYFDYEFEKKLDRGNFPFEHINFTKVLPNNVDTNSDMYLENYDMMQKLNFELEERFDWATNISPKEQGKLKERGKFTPRERINAILDRGSPFLEIGQLAGFDSEIPSGNIITGIGVVNGQKVMILCNNFTYKGGVYFPITVKKHLRAQEIAQQNSLPCIYLVDSGGAFLPEQDNVFPDRDHFGKIFYNQARMSAEGIP